MQLTDTHCHIHEAELTLLGDDATRALWLKANSPDPDAMIQRAVDNSVTHMICVGVTQPDSAHVVEFVQNRPNCWASIGIHPHEANSGQKALDALAMLANGDFQNSEAAGGARPSHSPFGDFGKLRRHSRLQGSTRLLPAAQARTKVGADRATGPAGLQRADKIVAIGEIGLDYFYSHSTKQEQIKALRFQIELALEHNLPIIFHVREAFDDFWPIFDSYTGIRGVLHSYTDTHANFQKAMERGLYIGINGITTFTKVEEQLQTAKEVPLQKLLLETDAPFLTPKPLRGTVNEPAHVRLVAEFLAGLRGQTIEDLAANTTHNAQTLFALS